MSAANIQMLSRLILSHDQIVLCLDSKARAYNEMKLGFDHIFQIFEAIPLRHYVTYAFGSAFKIYSYQTSNQVHNHLR